MDYQTISPLDARTRNGRSTVMDSNSDADRTHFVESGFQHTESESTITAHLLKRSINDVGLFCSLSFLLPTIIRFTVKLKSIKYCTYC